MPFTRATSCQTLALRCRTDGILRFFNNNASEFESVAAGGQQAVLQALSVDTYPDGGPVTRNGVFARYTITTDGTLRSASMAAWV
jgi:hypothetical protein